MQLLIAIVSVLAAGVLVVLVPGALLLATWRLDRIVPPPLVPAAALALGLVPLAAVTAATLLLRQPIEVAAATLGVGIVVGWGSLARRAHVERTTKDFSRVRSRTRPRDWMVPVRDLVAGEWLRGTPAAALVLAVIGGVLALVVGFHAWNDSLYHIAQSQKLLSLDAPSFDNTLQFPDGSAHPGYLLPTWHEAMALVAFVARVDVVTAAWILPALTFPISMLAFGGLGWSLARSRAATSVATAGPLLIAVAALPYSDAITNAMQPGVLGLGVLAPLVLAMLPAALWPGRLRDRDRDRDQDELSPRATTRSATFVAVVATAMLGMLHVSYLWVLGMGVLGYYLWWALRSPWPREVVRRHLLVGASVAVVAATVIALLYPGLANLEGLGRDAATELAANETGQYEGENDANLEQLLRGDPAGAFHLRNDYLVQAGGLALLGLFGLLLPLLAPRWPGGWYLSGAALIVLLIAQSDALFPRFVEVVTLDQARRIERVLPLSLGAATLALAIAAYAAHWWRGGGARRAVGAAIVAAGTIVCTAVVASVPALAGYAGERIVHPRVLLAALLVLAFAVVIQGAGLVVRLLPARRRAAREARGQDPRPARVGASWTWPTSLLDPTVGLVALVLLVVASTPTWDHLSTVTAGDRLNRVPVDMRGAELRLFSDKVAAELRELPVGAMVLADPRSRNPYTAMAIAPVYVVSSVPRHTALTPENRVDERFKTAVSFFEDGMTADDRRKLLLSNKVDAVLVHPAASAEMREQLEAMPGVTMVATGKNQRLYLVDREDDLEPAPTPRGPDSSPT
jgi:hypothetical protein